MKIGASLKSLRLKASLSTIQVAEQLHISESTYRKYETDKSSPTLTVLIEIANIYDKTLIDILPSRFVYTNNQSLLLEFFNRLETQITDLNNRMDKLMKQNE